MGSKKYWFDGAAGFRNIVRPVSRLDQDQESGRPHDVESGPSYLVREALDLGQEFDLAIALPPDASIKADLGRTSLGTVASSSKTRTRSGSGSAARPMTATPSSCV